jgi:S-DNA-T family DNA segregation ATPase FtsK/SpoIIIE
VDSRVILDTAGAEKLLGKGDMMLLTSGSPKPTRVQGTFVDDREIEKMVEFWQTQTGPMPPKITLHEEPAAEQEEHESEDDLIEQARDLAEQLPDVSASVLQRRLHVGFQKAMELRRQLEDEGLVPVASNR